MNNVNKTIQCAFSRKINFWVYATNKTIKHLIQKHKKVIYRFIGI